MDESLAQEQSSLEILKKYADMGYLFHGSPNGNIQELEPRPAKDVNSINTFNTFNTDNAVFATDDLTTSIIFGVVNTRSLPESEGLKSLKWSTNWSTEGDKTEVTAEIYKGWKPYVENSKGYVYVLLPDTFTEQSGRQRKSKVAVKPTAKVEVTLQDYYDAGGKLIWMEEKDW